ncbi:YfhO family protein [Hespellia stercorisuis]|uniref:Uncharacterized membrane protein YfhO n=1 Tax=Hespellia stercorisuis DSM 15480 TaxID=1121950 RepID=A0A1M6JYR5_9FIRM|nr:YfhO family protein [Hespellia stercorisuis]SHJ51828.1 Uncharacterized membrane protein YfhO [Hespellia stercorisuis DSM 15480]
MKSKRDYLNQIGFYVVIMISCGAIFLTGLWHGGFFPFGDRSMLLWDMQLQYIDYFAYFKEALSGNVGILYSFTKSLGGNMISLWSFYLMSPFNLFILLFSKENLQSFVVLASGLKMAMCGLTMGIYLKQRFQKLLPWQIWIFAVSYAFMEYNLLQISNLMWIDGVYMLPLVLLGVYRYVTQRRHGLLVGTVAASILFNWYSGYMVCLFACLYFLYEKLRSFDWRWRGNLNAYIKSTLGFAGRMLLGVGLTMPLFLPNIMQLTNGKGSFSMEIFHPEFTCTQGQFLRGFFVFEWGKNGEVAVAPGILMLLLGIAFFLNRRISKRERGYTFLFLGFMLFSVLFGPLNCIWSGLRFVYSYLYRYGFVVLFLLLYLAAVQTESLMEKYGRAAEKKKAAARIVSAVCVTWVLCETLFNLSYIYQRLYGVDINEYKTYTAAEEKLTDEIKEREDAAFYRVDTTDSRCGTGNNLNTVLNESMAYGYSSINHYCSTFDYNTNVFISKLGYSDYDMMSVFDYPILSSDALLGVKYMVSESECPGYEKTEIGDGTRTVYENPYSLGLGVKAEASVTEPVKETNPFLYQNQLFTNILGEETPLYGAAAYSKTEQENMVEYSFTAPENRGIVYAYITTETDKEDVHLFVDGEDRGNYTSWMAYKVFPVCEADGKEHQIQLRSDSALSRVEDVQIYTLDLDVLASVSDTLNQESMETTQFEDGVVSGTYESAEEGKLLLNIPYDAGWEIKVNDEKITPETMENCLMVIPVSQGENQIELRYKLPGLIPGLFTALLAAVVLLILQLRERSAWRASGCRKDAKSCAVHFQEKV